MENIFFYIYFFASEFFKPSNLLINLNKEPKIFDYTNKNDKSINSFYFINNNSIFINNNNNLIEIDCKIKYVTYFIKNIKYESQIIGDTIRYYLGKSKSNILKHYFNCYGFDILKNNVFILMFYLAFFSEKNFHNLLKFKEENEIDDNFNKIFLDVVNLYKKETKNC